MKTYSMVLAVALAAAAVPASARAQTGAPATPAPAAEVKAPTPKLETLVGFYEIAPGRGITVTLVKDTLHAMAPNGEGVRLIPKSGNVFQVEDKGMTVSFTLDKEGRPTEFVMHDGDAQRVFTRKNEN